MKKLPVLLLLTLTISGSCSYPTTKGQKDVMKAYDLRMEGKTDQALTLIDSLLALDSTNAMAWYERSRIQNSLLVAGMPVTIEEILGSIEKAAMYDSGNVIYAYTKAMNRFLKAYMALHKGGDGGAAAVQESCREFEYVLQLRPDYPLPMLQLVEIYGLLPHEMGGDSVKALAYAELLGKTDDFFAARATLVLHPVDNAVKFWQEYLVTHDTTAEALTEAGVACLFMEVPDQAETWFSLAMQRDSTKNTLLLDLARYYMMQVMQNRDLADSLLPISAKYIEQYLDSRPAPVIPLKAYATGMLVKTQMFTGHKEEAEALMEKAKSLDPYFSRAFAIPGPAIFDPPDRVNKHFSSFFRPF